MATISSRSSGSVSLSTLERLQMQDPRAWSRLAAVFTPLVVHWVLKAGVRQQDAADVVQEVFRVVATRIRDFESGAPGATFRGWLFGIAHNKVLAYRRRMRNEPQALGGSDARLFFEQLADAPDLDFDADDGLDSLCHRAAALVRQECNGTMWQAFIRVVVDGHRPDLVATELGISVNSVYLAKSRILRRIRQEIGSQK